MDQVEETSFQKIAKAIKNKKQISFEYKKEGQRIGNPHNIYISIDGEINSQKVDIMQISGVGTNSTSFLKSFLLAEIINIEVLDTDFEVAEKYNSEALRYAKVLVDVNDE